MQTEVEQYLQSLRGTNEDAAFKAAIFFIDHLEPRSIPGLWQWALTGNEDIAFHCAWALKEQLGGTAFVEEIGRKLSEVSAAKRVLLMDFLCDFAAFEGSELFLELMDAPQPAVVQRALMGLGFSGDPTLVDKIQPFLSHSDKKLSIAALNAIQRLDGSAALWDALNELDSADEKQRLSAVVFFQGTVFPRAAPVIARLVSDSHQPESIRIKGLRALGTHRAEETFEVVLNALNDPQLSIRKAAVENLGFFGDSRATAPLLQYLKDGEKEPAGCAKAAISLYWVRDPQAVQPLIQFTRDERVAVRRWSIYALSGLHSLHEAQRELVRTALTERLGDPVEIVVRSALHAISMLQLDETVDVVLPLLDCGSLTTQKEVVRTLGSLNRPETIEPLVALAEAQNPLYESAISALGRMDHSDPALAAEQLAPELANPKSPHRRLVIKALGQIGDRAQRPVLQKVLGKKRKATLELLDTLESLARLGEPGAADRIATYLSGDRDFQARAAFALCRLQDRRGVERAIQEINSRYWNIKLELVQALAFVVGDPAARRALGAMTDDPDQYVRAKARAAIIGPPREVYFAASSGVF